MSAGTPETYPDTMPGTKTVNMSDHTHDKAVKQTYYLADAGGPVTQGEHERDVITPGEPAVHAPREAGDGS